MKKLGAFVIRFLILLLKTAYLEANREARE
jgi:hypothetical protein